MKHEPIVATRTKEWPWIAGVVIVSALVIFYRLGTPAVYWWDEARVAINSLEMMHHPGLVVTFHGEPDLWNTKPPLSVWLSALSMALFGANEWALRLPSALAAIGTTVAVFTFTRRIADRLTACLAALALLGIGGYVGVHVTRSADYDSLLVLFTTLTTFSLFFAFESRRFGTPAALFTGAIMTKGVAGLMMAPGYLLYAVIYRKPIRAALIPGAIAAVSVLLFFAAREWAEPGYLSAVWVQDIARFGQPADGHAKEFGYYLTGLISPWQWRLGVPWHQTPYLRSAFPWSIVALLALIRPCRPTIYLLCCLGSFLLIVSLAATRLAWYVAPAYPLIAVLAALGVRRLNSLVTGEFVYPMFLMVAVGCIGLNIWKIDKEFETIAWSELQRQPNAIKNGAAWTTPEFAWRTPAVRGGKITGSETYLGPLEFYSARRPHARCPRTAVLKTCPGGIV